MPNHKLAFLGFGNVGKALAQLLKDKRQELRQRYDITFAITGIATRTHGTAVNPGGIALEQALNVKNATALSVFPSFENPFEFIERCQADVLFETTPVNYFTGQPAIDYISAALASGMHVVTANKGAVVHAYRNLKHLADQNGVNFLFESTVMDGAPVFSLFRETLPAARLLSFKGVLNSTTNMILTQMEAGEEFSQAVAHCRKIGIAETDPSGDIHGWDAAVKVAALVTVLMDIPLLPVDVARQGIDQLTVADIQTAKSQGKRWKLLCSAERQDDRVQGRVAPQLVGIESPFYNIEGTTSIVQFETDVLGLLSVVETDPGPRTTAYGMLADMLRAVR